VTAVSIAIAHVGTCAVIRVFECRTAGCIATVLRLFSWVSKSKRSVGRLRLKCDGTCAETRFRLSAKRTSPFKLAEASVKSTAGSRGVRISGSNTGYTMFRGSVKSTGYPLHSSVCPSLPLPCVTVCHHISTGVYPSYRRLGGLQFLSGQVWRRKNPCPCWGSNTETSTNKECYI